MPPEQTPLPQNTPEPFNFFETDSKKNFAPWFLTFCAVLIIIGIGIDGYFKYQAYQSYKEGLSVTGQNQVATSTDEFADWKTYRNEEYGFEFKYPDPGNVVLFESNGLEGDYWKSFIVSMGTVEEIEATTKMLEELKDSWGGIEGGPAFLSIKYVSSKIKSTCDLTNPRSYLTKINIGGVLWDKCINNDAMHAPALNLSYSIDDVNYFSINVDNYGGPYGEEHKKEIDKILSTFKFIEPVSAVDTSTWKTYTNTKYGFSFKYPKEWIDLVDRTTTSGANGLFEGYTNLHANTESAYSQPGDIDVHVSLSLMERNGEKISFSQLMLLVENQESVKAVVPTIIDGKDAFIIHDRGYDGKSEGDGYPSIGKGVNIKLDDDKYLYFRVSGSIKYFDQILSTFKFIE